jgi:hypothetical protein
MSKLLLRAAGFWVYHGSAKSKSRGRSKIPKSKRIRASVGSTALELNHVIEYDVEALFEVRYR